MSARASFIEQHLRVAPSSLSSFTSLSPLTLGIEGAHQLINAALALCIVRHWRARFDHHLAHEDDLLHHEDDALHHEDNIHEEEGYDVDEQVRGLNVDDK